MRVLHVLASLGPGGPGRSLAVLVEESLQQRDDIDHAVLVLSGPSYMPLRLRLKRLGCAVLDGATPAVSAELLATADIVLVHYWNTPALWDWIAEGLPPARYVLWSKVEGSHPPQRLSRTLVEDAAGCIFTAPPPSHLERTGPVVPGLVEYGRVRAVEPRAHPGFRADYIGTLTRGKLHPAFFEMMQRVDVPDLRVRLCGGALDPFFERSLAGLADAGRFEQLGFVEDIAGILETSDVFAYPLAPATYASSDKSLQEAMLAGVPPVVLAGSAPSRFVADGETGIVAPGEDEFVDAIERLYREPESRARLGRAARAHAETAFDPRPLAARMLTVLKELLDVSKRPLTGGLSRQDSDQPAPPAVRFLVSQGLHAEMARMMHQGIAAGAPEAAIGFGVDAGDDLYRLEGGILQWRNRHPGDPALRLWAGIWLDRQGDGHAAEAEYAAAGPLTAERLRACLEARNFRVKGGSRTRPRGPIG